MTQQPFSDTLLQFFKHAESIMWGWPMLVLLILTGLYLTVLLKGLQFRTLIPSLRLAFTPQKSRHGEGDISHFQALMTALSATVGTGNIAGVATAVSIGGPGALFWMWMTGFLGMATKFSEAVLGVYYRHREEETGEMSGGPMYYILHGLSEFPLLKKFKIPQILAAFFAALVVIAAVNIGNMIQANSVADAVSNSLRNTAYSSGAIKLWTGIVIAIITAFVIIGGIKRIGNVASKLVPVMIVLYVGSGLYILGTHWDMIDDVFMMIFDHAFSGIGPVAGGFAGATVKEVMQAGFSRGVFSNESGLGSAPIAAAAAQTPHPVEQALVSMTQTFIDTIVVCTFTGLIIVLSGLWATSDPEALTGAALTAQAFGSQLPLDVHGTPLGEILVAICLIFFAYSTIIGWYYYGEKGINYLAGQKSIIAYRGVYVVCLVIGAVQPVPLIWTIASVMIAFMIFPNLLTLLLLSGKVKALTSDFLNHKKTGEPFTLQAFFHDIETHK